MASLLTSRFKDAIFYKLVGKPFIECQSKHPSKRFPRSTHFSYPFSNNRRPYRCSCTDIHPAQSPGPTSRHHSFSYSYSPSKPKFDNLPIHQFSLHDTLNYDLKNHWIHLVQLIFLTLMTMA